MTHFLIDSGGRLGTEGVRVIFPGYRYALNKTGTLFCHFSSFFKAFMNNLIVVNYSLEKHLHIHSLGLEKVKTSREHNENFPPS